MLEGSRVDLTLRGNYSLNQLDRMVDDLRPLSALDAETSVHLSLAGIEGISPAALSLLISMLLDLGRRGLLAASSSCTPPTDESVSSRLADVGFDRLLSGRGAFQIGHDAVSCPCHAFDDEDSALRVAVGMGKECELTGSPGHAIKQALHEVGQNVIQHADSLCGGVGAAERSREESHTFEVAVADSGIGIPRGLARNPDFASLSDDEALRAAVQAGVTSSALGDGWGLFNAQRLAVDNGGRLVIRSGTAMIETGRQERVRAGLAHYPGTVVAFQVRDDKPLALRLPS